VSVVSFRKAPVDKQFFCVFEPKKSSSGGNNFVDFPKKKSSFMHKRNEM